MTTIQVKERPILFSGAMVRALLAGTKTQTRRAVKGIEITEGYNPGTFHYTVKAKVGIHDGGRNMELADLNNPFMGFVGHCPYGQPGDRLWVREAWSVIDDGEHDFVIQYRADDYKMAWYDHGLQYGHLWREMDNRWRPSIHMPHAFSRLLLEITAVRVERVQDISNEDAVAEGCRSDYWSVLDWKHPQAIAPTSSDSSIIPVSNYASLWQEINGPDSWATNPWVWVVEFKVVSP